MTIFTYHENIPTWNHRVLVQHWKQSWRKAGHRPIIMGREMARRHPMFGDFITKIRTFPTINDRHYEEACYIRWLAFEVMIDATDGRAVMADYDVFPNGFNDSHLGTEDVICHELTKVPCMVEATKKGAREIVEWIMSREPDHSIGHYSDMIAFKENKEWPITGYCLELGEKRGQIPWKKAEAIHAASGAIHREAPGWDKTKYIRKHFK
jgi:hypothetical protein